MVRGLFLSEFFNLEEFEFIIDAAQLNGPQTTDLQVFWCIQMWNTHQTIKDIRNE